MNIPQLCFITNVTSEKQRDNKDFLTQFLYHLCSLFIWEPYNGLQYSVLKPQNNRTLYIICWGGMLEQPLHFFLVFCDETEESTPLSQLYCSCPEFQWNLTKRHIQLLSHQKAPSHPDAIFYFRIPTKDFCLALGLLIKK